MRCHTNFMLLFALLIFSQLLLLHPTQAQTANIPRIGIDLGHGNLHVTSAELSNFTGLLVANEVQILYSVGVLNSTYLESIDAFIISSPQVNFTQPEVADLISWYASHGRLWLSSSYESVNSIISLNALLRALGSNLRFEYGYASDPLYNLNSTSSDGDQVILPLLNHQVTFPAILTRDLRILYAFRPIPIITAIGQGYTPFNASLQPNDSWLAETSNTAIMLNSSSTQLLAYARNMPARAPIAVAEHTLNSYLALTGSPFFSQWMQLFSYNPLLPYDNRVLTRNLLNWLTGLSITTEFEASIPEIRGTTQPQVVIYTGSQSIHTSSAELQPLTSLLTDMGFSAQTFSQISFASIKNATAIIMETPEASLSINDTGIITQWMQLGNRTLILASSAAYSIDGNATFSSSLNSLLSSLQSSLRFELGALYDSEVNVGGDPTLTLASSLNHIGSAAVNLTKNVRSLSMQFGTILAGSSNQTNFLPLENQTVLSSLVNVTWIAKSSNQSVVYNLRSGTPMKAHKDGERGSYIDAALERYRSDKYHDTILLTGGPIFSNFGLLLQYPTLFGYPTDNLLLLRNLFSSLLKQTEQKTEVNATAFPSQLPEGGRVTLNAQYNALFTSVSNLTEVERVPVSPANATLTLASNTLTTTRLSNQTFTGTGTPTGTGATSWTVSASSVGYQHQTASGTIRVNPRPDRFTIYVLGIPIVIFIAVTIAIFARKTR